MGILLTGTEGAGKLSRILWSVLFVGLMLAGSPVEEAMAPDSSARTPAVALLQASSAAQRAQQRPPLTLQSRAGGGVTLDFETGDLRGWTPSGTAFSAQPTLGDNSRARGSQPANHQGDFWVGTFENHPRGSRQAGAAQGDRPQGTLVSTPFNVPEGTLSFLVGGGSAFETRVELRLLDPIEGAIRVAFASGTDSETMRRETWELERWTGQRAQIRIIDEASGPWGHINVDDFRFSALQQRPEIGPLDARPEILAPPQLSTTRVPPLIGENVEDARKMLAELRLELGEVAREPSNRPAGTVLRQRPEASTVVRVGSAVSVSVAAPAPPEETRPDPNASLVVVPDVVNRDLRVALEILRAEGLQGRVADRRESPRPPGTVLVQLPGAGNRVDPGSIVELTEAIPRTTAVPNLMGRSEAGARRLLEMAELRAGTVATEESRGEAGAVLAQSVPAESVVALGTAVDLVVATPMRTTVPDLIEVAEQEARRQLEAAELVVGQVVEAESRRPPGIVVTQSERPGSRVVLGTAVDLVVSISVTLEVPDLAGRGEQEARGLLEGLELRLGDVTTNESRAPVGSVLSQRPAAGTRVPIETPVDILVAEPVTVLVPNLVGRGEGQARQQLGDFELGVGNTALRESRQQTGTVLAQSIEPGVRVVVGTTLDLVIAEAVRVTVPEVIGRSEADAGAAIRAVELVVGEVSYQESAAQPGTVLTQSLNPGTQAQIGSAVNLLVAVIETVPVPAMVGSSVEEARRALVIGRLSVGTEELRETRVEPEGAVMEQSRAAGTAVAVGTSINLVVATPEIVTVPSVIGLGEEEAAGVIIGAGLVVGAVGESLSVQAGGTVLEQAQPAGSQVVFGTPVALQVARDRSIWAVPAGLLLFVIVVGTVVARLGSKRSRRARSRQEEPPAEEPPIPEIRVRPVTDAGTQRMQTDSEPAARNEIRLRPRIDAGVQEIQSPGELIAEERREDE